MDAYERKMNPSWIRAVFRRSSLQAVLSLCVILSPARSATAAPQQSGAVDLRAEIEAKIAELEQKLQLNLDAPAERQAVLLRWLIELCESAGKLDKIRESYEKILSFFPGDVGTLNDYAEFLIDKAKDTETAREMLGRASAYAKFTDAPSSARARTFFLRGKLSLMEEDHGSAIQYLQKAKAILGDESPEEVLRALGQSCYKAGRIDEAADVYLELIGKERGLNRDDIHFLGEIIDRTDSYRGRAISELVADAVSSEKSRLAQNATEQGAEIVSIASDDGFLLEGTYYSAGGAGAVLFVPGRGRLRSFWSAYAQMLRTEGIHSLAIDLRGQGGSKNDTVQSLEDAQQMSRLPSDIAAALNYLRSTLGVSEADIVLATEGKSCEDAEIAIYESHFAPNVVYLSPTFDFQNQALRNAIAFHTDRPIFIAYSAEDWIAAHSCRGFSRARRVSQLVTLKLENAGRGLDMLTREPKAHSHLRRWIIGVLQTGE